MASGNRRVKPARRGKYNVPSLFRLFRLQGDLLHHRLASLCRSRPVADLAFFTINENREITTREAQKLVALCGEWQPINTYLLQL